MTIVHIPPLMRDLTGGTQKITMSGKTVGEVIHALDAVYPGIRARLCKGERLRPTIAIAVDGYVSRLGLRQPVGEDSEIRFLPVIEGG